MLDCPGKIRYPHILSDASKFQLTKGSSFLQVYYVTLPRHLSETDRDERHAELNNNNSKSSNSTVAAHAFCNRCGVHILRAPDSKKHCLEVNVHCVDDIDKYSVSFNDSSEHLSAGVAVPDQWNDEEDTWPFDLPSNVPSADMNKTPRARLVRHVVDIENREVIDRSVVAGCEDFCMEHPTIHCSYTGNKDCRYILFGIVRPPL